MASAFAEMRVLHIDDDVDQLEQLRLHFAEPISSGAMSLTSFLRACDFTRGSFGADAFNLVILDVHLAQHLTDDVPLLAVLRQRHPDAVIFVLSAIDNPDIVAECLRGGADDFLVKDAGEANFSQIILTTFQICRQRRTACQPVARVVGDGRAVGGSMHAIAQRLPMLLNSAVSSIHVFGESGAGKEVVSDLLQQNLAAGMPFVRVNCAAMTQSLIESELFGYVRGAFTGANHDRIGLLEAADGGWVFLDEIATLSLPAQAALLRVMENQEIRRVGCTRSRKIHIKIISATNQSIPDLVKIEQFRADLWQRLCEAEILIPPLRERRDEIADLVEHFLNVMDGGPYRIARPALDVLTALDWRDGNVRELRNCLRAMTELQVDGSLTPMSIPGRIWQQYYEQTQQRLSAESVVAAAADVQMDTDTTLLLHAGEAAGLDFAVWMDHLLLALVRRATAGARLSLRRLAAQLRLSPSTLSVRLHHLVERARISYDELAAMVSIQERRVADPKNHRQTEFPPTSGSAINHLATDSLRVE